MSSPSLIIRRVVVTGQLGCDLRLARGLSVIKSVAVEGHPKSTNKCGKTSFVELILHGFGRKPPARTKWYFAPIARKLHTLWLEIETNGRLLTIQRSLQELGANLRIHSSPYVAGLEKDPGESIPYDAMSDFMLDALRIPKVSVRQADGTAFVLTFPNLLRAFVLHQEDSFGQILDKMIPEQRRTDVLGFLTRITPLERFTLEEQLSAKQVALADLEGTITTIETFLQTHGVRSLPEIQRQYDGVSNALHLAIRERQQLQESIKAGTPAIAQTGHIDELQRDVVRLKNDLAVCTQQYSSLQQEEGRLKELLGSLQSDLTQVRRMQASQTVLSSVEFEICPRCTLDVTREMKQREQTGRCCLCNRMLITTSDSAPRAAGQLNDIGAQIAEVDGVLRDITAEQRAVSQRLANLQVKHDNAAAQLDLESRAYISPAVDALLAKTQAVGELEKKSARLEPILAQARALDVMRNEALSLRSDLATLQEQLRAASKPDGNRLSALATIYRTVLDRVEFPDVRDVKISPQSLLPFINGDLYIHVGTALKGLATLSYHLALLEFSGRFETFIPRILVIDSPAVGDLNDENHDRLLQYLAGLRQPMDIEPDWQVILTTRRSNPALDACVVETLSSPDRMLLR